MRHVTLSGSFCFCDAGLKKFATAFSSMKSVTLPSQVKSRHIRVIVDCCCLLTGGGDTRPESLRERFILLVLFVIILTMVKPIMGEK